MRCRCTDSCGICMIWLIEVGLALLLSFSSLPCLLAAVIYIFLKRIPLCTIHRYILGHYIWLEQAQKLTWNAKSPSRYHHVISLDLMTITLVILLTSSCYFYKTFSKDRQAHILMKQGNSLKSLDCTALEDLGKGYWESLPGGRHNHY